MGDPDNAFVGADFKWNLLNRFQLYGQLILDEWLFENLSNRGNWRNKNGVQLGAKYIDVAGISNLDLQLEFNTVRPYTYTHYRNVEYTNYQHYNQPLAHPLGANFREIIAIVRYQPIPKLNLTLKGISIRTGEDNEGENWGGNIFLDYNTRQQDENNSVGQGIATTINFLDFTASYQVRHNLFLDFKQIIRQKSSDDPTRELNSSLTNVGVRWNIPQRINEF